MTNILEHFGEKLEQQKEGGSDRISQPEACFIATLNEFKQNVHHAIPAYTEKEEMGMLKNEIETVKEENNKLKHDMSETEILMKSLTERLNKERAKKIGKEKPEKRENIDLDKIYH